VSDVTKVPEIPQSAWDEARRRRDFWDANFDRLLKQYRNRWVAVREGQVVADSEDLGQLLDELRERHLNGGRAWVEFIGDTRARVL